MMNAGVLLERNNALQDVWNTVNEYGDTVKIYLDKEPDITRDKYNSIEIKQTTDKEKLLEIKAFPIMTNPTKRMIEKAGLKEQTDIIIYTAMKDWIDRGFTIEDLNITKSLVIVQGKTYVVRDKTEFSSFADSYLYINIGLVLK
jgi:hypothetical protein